MFSNKKLILSFFNNSIFVFEVRFRAGKGDIKSKERITWDKDNLTKIFKALKRKYGSTFRILLPESKTYLKLLSISQDELHRSFILKKMQEAVPETIEESSFDWKIVEKKENGYLVQAVAVNWEYFQNIKLAVKETKVNIEAVESVSFALARLTKKEKEPHVITSSFNENIICACFAGEVYESVVLEPAADPNEEVKKLMDFIFEKWKVKIAKVIDTSLNPVLSLALKQDLKGEDAAILNLTVTNIEPPKEDDKKSPLSRYLFVVAVFLTIATLTAGAFFAFSNFQKNNKLTADQKVSPTSIPSPTTIEEASPTPAPTLEINREEIKISIINGAGIAGEATLAKEYLESLGYKDITVDNAESFDYTKTTVGVKEGKEEFADLVRIDLLEKYDVEVNIYTLDKDDDFDVQVIITTQKRG